jgi:methyl coenzyme M reductase subunit C
MSLRNDFADNIVDVLKNAKDPKPVLVTREPFDVEKLAITQFPAILVQSGNETREDYSMGVRRQGVITYTIRGFVRGGVEIDKQRNDLIERIEETLDIDRSRGTNRTSMKTQVVSIDVIDRLTPLGEVAITVEVRYLYNKGAN